MFTRPRLAASSRIFPLVAGLAIAGGSLVAGVHPAAADEPGSIVTVGSTTGFFHVACEPGATECYAIGTTGTDQASEIVPVGVDGHGTGGAITISPAVTLADIACPSAHLCIAVGTDDTGSAVRSIAVPLVDGQPQTQTAISVPNPQGISCASPTSCGVIGNDYVGEKADTEALTLAGNAVALAGPLATVTGITEAGDISCATGSTTCEVVGDKDLDSGPTNPYFAGAVGQVTPGLVGSTTVVPSVAALTGVDCTAGQSCVAVGGSLSHHGVIVPIGATVARAQELDNTGYLENVSCVGTDCEVVGEGPGNNGASDVPLAVALGGGKVTAERTFDQTGYLSGVDCTSATECTSVGTFEKSIRDTATTGLLASVAPVGSGAPTAPAPYCVGNVVGPVVGTAATPDGGGYWMTDADGDVVSCGDAVATGGVFVTELSAPIVGMAAGPDDNGFYLVAADGGVFNYGTAVFHGSAGNIHLTKPIVGMAADTATNGYWLVASDGGVFSYNAPFHGSAGNIHLTKPIVGMAATHDNNGYRLVASDGGVFAYNAAFHGSAGDINLTRPVEGMADDPAGDGYWLVASDGGIFAYNAPFHGSAGNITLAQPMIGMTDDTTTGGYRLVASDGGIFAYGARFLGSGADSIAQE